ncbi:hypothetical protein BRD06_06680 [Halobacteriales archaeon QS_9_67_15]|nr:MAG: hypothetical protein BRD06_06680 [Halobacteriales archaeon QS_9_67_15]
MEVSGELVGAVAGGVEKVAADARTAARQTVEDADLAAVESDKWYPLEACVDATEAIHDRVGDEDGRVECETAYPCAFDRGIVEGVAVAHADGFVCVTGIGACRNDGPGRHTYDVSW